MDATSERKKIEKIAFEQKDVIKEKKKETQIYLGKRFWLLTSIITFACGGIFPFLNISSGFLSSTYFKTKGKEGAVIAGKYYSIYLIISAILVPLFGIIMGRIKFSSYLIFTASILGIFSFALLNNGVLYFGYILLAICYSLFSSIIWPRLSTSVNPDIYVNLDLFIFKVYASGITSCLVNFTLFIIPLIFAAVFNYSKSYFMVTSPNKFFNFF